MRLPLTSLAAATALLLSGCSSSDDGQTPTPSEATQESLGSAYAALEAAVEEAPGERLPHVAARARS